MQSNTQCPRALLAVLLLVAMDPRTQRTSSRRGVRRNVLVAYTNWFVKVGSCSGTNATPQLSKVITNADRQRSSWVVRSGPSVCLSVCLSICLAHNSKTNVHIVFKLGIGDDFGLSYKLYVLGLKVKGQGHSWVNKCIFFT